MPGSTRFAAALTSVALTAGCLLGIAVAAAPADAWSSANLQLIGRGDGDGVGLSQDGAFGYATQSLWSANQILTHYYGGSVRSVGVGPITVDLVDQGGVDSLQVSSPGAAFRTDNVTVPAGAAAKLSYSATTGYAVQIAPAGCKGSYGSTRPVRSNTFVSTVVNPASLDQMLHLCGEFAYRGTLSMVPGRTSRFDHPFRVVNQLGLNDYLRSVLPNAARRNQQIDAGGNEQFLRAMAVTMRSLAATSRKYPWAKVDGHNLSLYYLGAGNSAGQSFEDSRTDEAVQATGSQVVLNAQGTAVAHTVFGISSGGWTAGGGFPVVQDAGDLGSPSHSWRAVRTISELPIQLGIDIGILRSFAFTRTGLGDLGGRVRTVTLRGDRGSATVTGAFFAYWMGLQSDWFAINTAPPAIHVSNGFASPVISYEGAFGQPGDQPFACDFDGDGKDTVGVYRARTGTFYIRNALAAGTPYYSVQLGTTGDIPVCGDWNGDGTDTVGVYDPRTARFYLIDSVTRTASTPLIQVLLGGRGFQPLAGDWDGDHHTTLGVWDPVQRYVYLVNSLAPGAPRSRYQLGPDGSPLVAGDFDGDGRDGYAQYAGGRFQAWNTPGGVASADSGELGISGDVPLAGDWDGDGVDSIGYATGY